MSCCDKPGTSCLLFCYKVDDGNRLSANCSNKTNTGCYQQVAASLLASTLLPKSCRLKPVFTLQPCRNAPKNVLLCQMSLVL